MHLGRISADERIISSSCAAGAAADPAACAVLDTALSLTISRVSVASHAEMSA